MPGTFCQFKITTFVDTRLLLRFDLRSYNDEVTATLWNDNDYDTANASMRHEAAMLQTHPSILAFLVGSDFWPDHRAAAIYVEALHDLGMYHAQHSLFSKSATGMLPPHNLSESPAVFTFWRCKPTGF